MKRSKVQKLAASGAFKSLAGRGEGQECMIVVGWTGLNDKGDDGRGHLVLRSRVSADLGLDAVPDPSFSSDEMQEIAFAAKMQALRCLRARRGK